MAQVAWWELSEADRYLWDHLIEHLRDTGEPTNADAVAGDLRWVGARLERFGPTAPTVDLAVAGTPRAARLRVVLSRASHLLAPTDPPGAVVDVLHSRVADDPDWGPQVIALRDNRPRPRLVNRWPLPDLADPALQRILTGRERHERPFAGEVTSVAVAPDGNWLACGGMDGTVRIWELDTGQQRAALTGHESSDYGGVASVAVAPDGNWLASGGSDGTVRIWDVATGKERATLTGHECSRYGGVASVAVAPDGSWLASAGTDGTVRIWDPATGQERATLTSHMAGPHGAVAVAPDGTWLASGGSDGMVRIWDSVTWRERATLIGHDIGIFGGVTSVAVAPDGTWLASAGIDGTVRIGTWSLGRNDSL